MNDEQAINLALTLLNMAIARSHTDPEAAAKIQAGQPLDEDDFTRLGINRDLAGVKLQAAIEAGGSA